MVAKNNSLTPLRRNQNQMKFIFVRVTPDPMIINNLQYVGNVHWCDQEIHCSFERKSIKLLICNCLLIETSHLYLL